MDFFLGKTKKTRSVKGTASKSHPGRKNYTTKKGDKVYHRKNHYVRKSYRPYTKKGGLGHTKGTMSVTHLGDMDYTTKKGDKVFHRNNHYVKRSRKPYMKGGSRR
jgi:hypothetical protein